MQGIVIDGDILGKAFEVPIRWGCINSGLFIGKTSRYPIRGWDFCLKVLL